MIFASQAGAILGVSPNANRSDAMRRMVRDHHGYPREEKPNPAKEWGIANEPNAVVLYEVETGRYTQKAELYKLDGFGAIPDLLVFDHDLDQWGCLEVKCPFGLRNEKAPVFKSILELDHYYAQCQIEMFCTGTSWCDFYQWAPRGFLIERVQFDHQWWSDHTPELEAFYAELLEAIREPDQYLSPKLPRINNARLRRLVDEYEQIADSIAAANARQCEIMVELLESAKGKEAEICGKFLLQRPSDPGYGHTLKSTWSFSK